MISKYRLNRMFLGDNKWNYMIGSHGYDITLIYLI